METECDGEEDGEWDREADREMDGDSEVLEDGETTPGLTMLAI